MNTILFCELTEVSCFKFLLQPKDNYYNTNALKSVVFNLFHSYQNKRFPKKWRVSVAYLKSPNNRFPFCYLQQLFIRSESANSRLRNTILVTHITFHLASLTLLTKKMLSTSERKCSQRSHVKDYFVFMHFSKTTPLV